MSKKVETAEKIIDQNGAEVNTEVHVEQNAAAVSNPLPAPEYSEEGHILKATLTARDIISQAAAIKRAVNMAPGDTAMLARIIGTCTGYAEKEAELPDGKISVVIGLTGVFEIEKEDGTRLQGTKLYMPGSAYSSEMKALFNSDSALRAVEVDCDLGIKATGKSITYEYVVRSHIRHDLVAELRGRRRPVWGQMLPLQPVLPSLEAPAS